MSQAKLKVTGRVQGVFYRVSTQDVARGIGLVGYVKNDPDGGVTVVANGPQDKIEKLIDWCQEGPSGSSVSEVKVDWMEEEEFSQFDIRH